MKLDTGDRVRCDALAFIVSAWAWSGCQGLEFEKKTTFLTQPRRTFETTLTVEVMDPKSRKSIFDDNTFLFC